jgi:hypothetical protein
MTSERNKVVETRRLPGWFGNFGKGMDERDSAFCTRNVELELSGD